MPIANAEPAQDGVSDTTPKRPSRPVDLEIGRSKSPTHAPPSGFLFAFGRLPAPRLEGGIRAVAGPRGRAGGETAAKGVSSSIYTEAWFT